MNIIGYVMSAVFFLPIAAIAIGFFIALSKDTFRHIRKNIGVKKSIDKRYGRSKRWTALELYN